MSSESIGDAVADILADAGLADDGALARTLESLRALCPPEAPKPSGALAEVLAHGSAAGGAVGPSRAGSRAAEAALGKLSPSVAPVVAFPARKRHRGAAISAAVIAGVGLSASGVAALGGVDYSVNPPQAEVRGPAAAPGSEAGACAPDQTSGSSDATVHQAQAFAAAASGGSVAHEEAPATTSGGAGDDARASSGAVVPSAPTEQTAEGAAAPAVGSAAAGAEEALSGIVRDDGAVVGRQAAPRHRADSIQSRGRHVAQEAAATAEALVAPFTAAVLAAPSVKEAVAMGPGPGAAQQDSSLSAAALGQPAHAVTRTLPGLGFRH